MCFNLLIRFLACSLRGLVVMVLSTFSFQLGFLSLLMFVVCSHVLLGGILLIAHCVLDLAMANAS